MFLLSFFFLFFYSLPPHSLPYSPIPSVPEEAVAIPTDREDTQVTVVQSDLKFGIPPLWMLHNLPHRALPIPKSLGKGDAFSAKAIRRSPFPVDEGVCALTRGFVGRIVPTHRHC